MHTQRSFWLPTLSLALLTLTFTGCSKDDGPTNPGTGGTTFHSGDLSFGQRFVHTFSTAGHFGYHCNRHSGMTGTIHVVAGGADSLIVLMSGNTFLAQGADVKPGGYVRWQNDDNVLHTVTSD